MAVESCGIYQMSRMGEDFEFAQKKIAMKKQNKNTSNQNKETNKKMGDDLLHQKHKTQIRQFHIDIAVIRPWLFKHLQRMDSYYTLSTGKNYYPLVSIVCTVSTYLLDSDLSG